MLAILVIVSALLSIHGVVEIARSEGIHHQAGRWELLLNNSGVVGMHMAVTFSNTVILFDQTGAGPSDYHLRRLPNGTRCSRFSKSSSCYAHSIEYDISSNRIRPLVNLDSDPWCSSGSFLSSGTLIQMGGYGSRGSRSVRYFRPCNNVRNRTCDWLLSPHHGASPHHLAKSRWYASNVLLPEEDRVMVVGGRGAFSYEFVPKRSPNERAFDLPLLHKTYDRREHGGNLYPFLHLSSDGHLFIFANKDSVLFDYRMNQVVKTFPKMPGDGGRNYPSSGSSVILPLSHKDGFQKVEVMICGGAAKGARRAAEGQHRYLEGVRTCGRMIISGNHHKWNMENMPHPRLLSDMILLPTGNILIINGAKRGAAGWENARRPALTPLLYNPRKLHGNRFTTLRATKIARMYHSSAVLLPDGRVLVAGSNPHDHYMLHNVRYPTELRLQAYVPHYMSKQYWHYRPQNVSIHNNHGSLGNIVRYKEEFSVRFWLGRRPGNAVEFSVYAPPFTTHTVGMNQRMLKLRCKSFARGRDGWMNASLKAPPSPNVAPAGYYMLTVLNEGIPSTSQWVRFIQN